MNILMVFLIIRGLFVFLVLGSASIGMSFEILVGFSVVLIVKNTKLFGTLSVAGALVREYVKDIYKKDT